ncbi:MAG: hypothetical protein V1847_04240 [Candidatus Diapherotrites archaeon]
MQKRITAELAANWVRINDGRPLAEEFGYTALQGMTYDPDSNSLTGTPSAALNTNGNANSADQNMVEQNQGGQVSADENAEVSAPEQENGQTQDSNVPSIEQPVVQTPDQNVDENSDVNA